MFTKKDLIEQIKTMGILPTDTVIVHTSLRAIGQVENGADGIIDAFRDYLTEGLFIVPTHTWDTVGPHQPIYDVSKQFPNFEKALVEMGAQTFGRFGNAEVRIVDAAKCREILLRIFQHADRDLCIEKMEIPEEWYK